MPDARTELVHYYRLLRQHGDNDSHSGNGSIREGATVWITPTGACGDTLEPDALVACHVELAPPVRASSDAPLHLAVHAALSEDGAVLHSHGPHTIALSLAGDDFRPVDFEGRMLFPRVPVIDIPLEAHRSAAPPRLAETLAEHPAAILRGHGIYARGRNAEEAYRWCSQVEACARIAWLARL